MKKRILSMLLCVVLCLSVLPMSAFAAAKLETPSNLHWEGTKALWDKVENASNDYRVTLYKNGTELFHGLAGHNYGRQFDTSMAEYGEGEYTFTVTALAKEGSDFIDSDESSMSPVFFFTDKMDTPTGLKWDNYFATWDAVADATTYEATLLKNGESCGCVTSSTCVADLSELITHNGSGTYTFSVVAYGPKLESNPAESPSKTINITPLPAPANLHWEGTKALWDKVENASNDYRVTLYKNGTELFHGLAGHNYGRQFDTSIAEYGEGEYTFTVQALPKKGQIEYGEGIVSPHSPVYSTYPSGTVKISFDANGGSVTPDSAETGTNGKLASLPTPTRSGYSFDGWYTMKEGGTKVDTNTVFTAAATIYAHWSRSFSFADLPETGVTNITVPEGDYYTRKAAKEAFITFWNENIKTEGEFALVDCFDVDVNGYHTWIITIENDVISTVDGGYAANLDTILSSINNPNPIYDWWINGTYEKSSIPITEVTVLNFESPIPNKTTGELSNLQIPEGAHYKFDPDFPGSFSRWYDEESEYGYLQNDVIFTVGKDYQEGAWLIADEGYYFADDCTFKAIGADSTEKELDKMSTFVDEYDITKANIWAVYEKAGTPITEVTVLNFESPISGKTTGELSNLQIPEGAHYKFDPEFPGNFSRWYDVESEYGYLQNDVTFTEGKEYQEGAWLAADEGYYFADDCTFKAIGADNTEKELDEMSTFVDEYDITKANIWAAYETAVAPIPVTYTIIVGANGEWTKGSAAGLAFTSDAPFDKFDSVKIDGTVIAAANYTAEAGSTKITLAPAYLETLSVGTHTIEIVSNDGSASTNFTVKSAEQPPVVPTNYTVTFNMNGHGDQVAAQTVNEGAKATKPADPTASGWTFNGWYADATFSAAFDFNTAINADTTIYAKWTQNTTPPATTYTVSFNMNGHGTQIADQTVEDGSKAAKPADPKASGYTFGGWYADATFSTKFDFNTAITANTTVYAKWTKNSAAPADPTSPQTGDTSNMFLWIALLLVSGGALVGTAVYGKKKKYRAE